MKYVVIAIVALAIGFLIGSTQSPKQDDFECRATSVSLSDLAPGKDLVRLDDGKWCLR